VRLRCEAQVELRNGAYVAVVAPAAGGRITTLSWDAGGVRCPLLVDCDIGEFDEHDWPKAGAFPMIPFTNRLGPQGLRVGDTVVMPERGPGGIAVHGFAHRRHWTLTDRSATRAVMRLAHNGTGEGWPWAWSAEQEVVLGPLGLTIRLRVTNLSGSRMPLGLGWHPYHPVHPEALRRSLGVHAGCRHDLDLHGRARRERLSPVFGMARGETAAFDSWSGTVRLPMPAGRTLRIECCGAERVVLHRPISGDYLCVEPVTVLPGLLGTECGDAGELAPGGERVLTWSCGIEQSG
jgi:aldose 1-epimerase